MITATKRLTHVETRGLRQLARQLGPFLGVVDADGTRRYQFRERIVDWPEVRQAARESDALAKLNVWRCGCGRLMPYFLRRCKVCRRPA